MSMKDEVLFYENCLVVLNPQTYTHISSCPCCYTIGEVLKEGGNPSHESDNRQLDKSSDGLAQVCFTVSLIMK